MYYFITPLKFQLSESNFLLFKLDYFQTKIPQH